jgi:threonine dehydrogenase-like Zn-dependent dehydrogenase
MQLAAGRPIIFKLHPNELPKRAIAEIQEVAGEDANIYTTGSAEEMVANCAELITQYSTLAYVGLILGKKTHSYFDMEDLKKKIPLQNGGKSAERIAEICRGYIEFNGKGSEYLKTILPFK